MPLGRMEWRRDIFQKGCLKYKSLSLRELQSLLRALQCQYTVSLIGRNDYLFYKLCLRETKQSMAPSIRVLAMLSDL